MKALISSVLLFFMLGCSAVNPEILSKSNLNQIVEHARGKIVLTQNLSDKEIEIIKSDFPHHEYYVIAGNYAQYRFSWKLSETKSILLYGQGDIRTLDDSVIEFIDMRK